MRAYAHATAKCAFVLFSFDLLPFATKRNKIKRTRLFLKYAAIKRNKINSAQFQFSIFFYFNSATSNKQE